MKKLITLFVMMFALSAMLMSCSKEPVEPKTATISLNYAFNIHSAQLKSADANYLAFYNKYIVTRLLTPYSYKLVFQGRKGFVGDFSGAWKKNQLFTLPVDTYYVTGTSNPIPINPNTTYCSDTCYIVFNDTIVIDANTSNILLDAKYNCYMIAIDNVDVSSCTIEYQYFYPSYIGNIFSRKLKNTENFYHSFISNANGITDSPKILISGKNGFTPILQLNSFSWEYGKYYYFTSIGGTYTLAPMTN